MPPSARHRGAVPRSRRISTRAVAILGTLLVVLSLITLVAYHRLEGNIHTLDLSKQLGDRPDVVEATGPQKPMNVLVMGSDSREGENASIGGDTPGLSDTTILLHLSADRSRAYGVSLPRDSMVERPECPSKSGKGTVPGGLTMFNTAYALGGPACTIKTVEQLTRIRVDHFVVIDFTGFKAMVNAIKGVEICVPKEVDDDIGHIKLPAGTYDVTGDQALDYVRLRHDIGAETGDIGRMKRQQAFISAMIAKVMSAGTLANPARLYSFLDAATKSLTTDEEFANLRQLASLGQSLKSIGLDNVQFVTVPFQEYAPDPNRLEWSADAEGLWKRIRNDQPLGPYGDGALTPADDSTGKSTTPTKPPSGSPSPSPTETPSGTPSGSPSGSPSPKPGDKPSLSPEDIKQAREAAGLCT